MSSVAKRQKREMKNQLAVKKKGRLKVCIRNDSTREWKWRHVKVYKEGDSSWLLHIHENKKSSPLMKTIDLTRDFIHCYEGRDYGYMIMVLSDQPNMVMMTSSQEERKSWLQVLTDALTEIGRLRDVQSDLSANSSASRGQATTVHATGQDEFLNSWFPSLDTGYLINHNIPGNTEGINHPDVVHQRIQSCLSQIKENIASQEVMVMLTQARFSMYDNIVPGLAAVALAENMYDSQADEALLKYIVSQGQEYSDLMVVNKQHGILLGVVQSVSAASDSNILNEKLLDSLTYLERAGIYVKKVVEAVCEGDNVAVHRTLILPNILRTEIDRQLFPQSAKVLCKDEMVTENSLRSWWTACWTPTQTDIGSDCYRRLVAKFAIPATRVEIYLTTQPRLQLKHEHDVVAAVGDSHSANKVFQAGLHQLSLFRTQAELLDCDHLDEIRDDVKFLFGPPGTGKTILLVLRALQWVKQFRARQIFILQTMEDGTAAAFLIRYQLQQTLNAQQQRARQSGTDTQSAQCTFTLVDLPRLLKRNISIKDKFDLRTEDKKKLLYELNLSEGSGTPNINIVADDANGDVIAAVYDWLKETRVTTVRLWAAGVKSFRYDQDSNQHDIPDSLQEAVWHVTEPLRCPGQVVEEVVKANKIKKGRVLPYKGVSQLTGGSPVSVTLSTHYMNGRDGHSGDRYPWNCDQCNKDLVAKLKSLHVGEADDGHQGFSANDVFILGSSLFCNDYQLAAGNLTKALHKNGYNVRELTLTSQKTIMETIKNDCKSPAITVAQEKLVGGLERKIVVYFESGFDRNGVIVEADEHGRLRSFSRSTQLLIYITTDRFSTRAT